MSQDFAQVLHNLTLEPCDANTQAIRIINTLRNENQDAFIEAMLPFIGSDEVPVHIRIMAMIVTLQMFPTLREMTGEPFEGFNEQLIFTLLNTAFDCFGNESPAIRSNSANLFARIARIDVCNMDKFGIIPTLLKALADPPSILSLEAVFMVLTDLFEVTQLKEDELNAVLQALFNYMAQEAVPDAVKNACLIVLKNIIDNMGELLEEDENVAALFRCLIAMSQNPGTKARAFEVWTQFTLQYYPMLQLVANDIVQATFIELANDMNDRDVLIQVCMFWEAVAECEMSKSAELQIIDKVVDKLIPVLFKIAASVDAPDCDFKETFEPHVAAATAMQGVVACAKDKALPVLVQLIKDFAFAKPYGLREGALHCINFAIQFCDASPIL